MTAPICLFDSGIGGLTVLKKLIAKFPNENYIYLADLERVPFGDKTREEIKTIAGEIIDWLSKFNPKLIIMACNTSSAVLQDHGRVNAANTIPVYGIIESCAKEIVKLNHNKISIWATKLVVETKAYKNAIHKINPNIEVEEIACPKLVPMIENLNFTISERNKIILECMKETSKDSKGLILGCTHYPLIQNDIKNLFNTEIIDPADSLTKELEKYLTSTNGSKNGKNVSLYTTAQIDKMKMFSKAYLQEDFKVNLVSLNKIKV